MIYKDEIRTHTLYFSFFPLMKSKTQKSMREQLLKIF